MERGRIVKALSGFYYVDSGNGTLTQCRARGRFRKERMSPLVGDWVRFSGSGAQGMVEEIEPRRNSFIRPAVSNLDALVVLASGANPVTDPFLIDRVAAIAGNQNVPVVLCVNKTDLESGESLTRIYRHAGFPVFPTSAASGEGVAALHEAVRGKTVAFTGNSGVGKSSILNCLGFSVETGEVSEKLGRGRHTTRHVELFPLADGTCVIDTPGFSSFDTEQMELILKENLQYAFPDFAPYLGRCRYHDCAHLSEPGCAVLEALAAGELLSDNRAALTFTGAIDDRTVTVKKNGAVVENPSVTYDADNLTLYVDGGFTSGDSVEIITAYGTWTGGIKDDRVQLTAVALNDGEGPINEPYAEMEQVNASVTVANAADGAKVTAYAALYDSEGRLVKIAHNDAVSAGGTATATAALAFGRGLVKGDVIRVFAWNAQLMPYANYKNIVTEFVVTQ